MLTGCQLKVRPIGNSGWRRRWRFCLKAGKKNILDMDSKIKAPYKPLGDQPQAIKELVEGIQAGEKHQVLLGATGTGKTFTIANVIEQVQKPALVSGA